MRLSAYAIFFLPGLLLSCEKKPPKLISTPSSQSSNVDPVDGGDVEKVREKELEKDKGTETEPVKPAPEADIPPVPETSEMKEMIPSPDISIKAPADKWTWINIPGAVCRDGSPADIVVNWHSNSSKILMHLDGGWACWNKASCSMNPSNIGAKNDPGSAGHWDRKSAKNPFADYNYVSVRNCTGDFYSGNNPDADVPGVGKQKFVGYANLDLYLTRILATFPNLTEFVLAGTSAGGFGVYFNAEHFARRMPGKKFVALAACGHPVPSEAFAPCLQEQFRDLWGMRKTVLSDCGDDCKSDSNFVFDSVLHFLKGPNRSAGFFGSLGDDADRWVYGWGANQCQTSTPNLPVNVFTPAMLQLREKGSNLGASLSTFYGKGEGHECWMGDWDRVIDNVKLGDWVKDILQGKANHVGNP